MTLRLIGAGLPRTGTTSLKRAVEYLLGGRCYHMTELVRRSETDIALWRRAISGQSGALEAVTAGWDAIVDWPGAVFWRELHDLYPQAIVVLSHRESESAWFTSVENTIGSPTVEAESHHNADDFVTELRAKAGLAGRWSDRAAAIALYRKTIHDVTTAIPVSRLIVWQPADGWPPLCAALGVPVPAIPFYHLHTTTRFHAP